MVLTERVAHRLALATELGATDTIDASVTPDVGREIEHLLGQAPMWWWSALAAPGCSPRPSIWCGRGARWWRAGCAWSPNTFSHLAAYGKEPTVRFPQTYTKAENEFVIEMIATGRIDPRPLLSHRVTLDEFPLAFEALRNPTDQCKVVLTP